MNFFRPKLPTVALEDGLVARRQGRFYRKTVPLSSVERIVALKRDAFTGEEVLVAFMVGGKIKLWVSEFDQGFVELMNSLPQHFPGMADIASMPQGETFQEIDFTLWPQQ